MVSSESWIEAGLGVAYGGPEKLGLVLDPAVGAVPVNVDDTEHDVGGALLYEGCREVAAIGLLGRLRQPGEYLHDRGLDLGEFPAHFGP